MPSKLARAMRILDDMDSEVLTAAWQALHEATPSPGDRCLGRIVAGAGDWIELGGGFADYDGVCGLDGPSKAFFVHSVERVSHGP